MILIGILISALFAHPSRAAVGDRFGYTSEAASLGGARVGGAEFSSAAAYENPAQLSLLPESGTQTQFHWSVLYSKPSFADIKNVVVENPVNSDKTTGDFRKADVDTRYPSTFGQSIGISTQSKRSLHRWGLGAVFYLPLDHLALIDSGESFVPEYTLHRGRTQKPEFQFAFSGLISKTLSFGAGIQLGTRLASDTTLFLNQGTGTASSMRVAASLKTKASPYFGLTYLVSPEFSTGFTARMASSQPQSMNVQANARAIGTVSALSFAFPTLSTLYYDPFTLQLGSEWKYSDTSALYFEIDYQAWSNFQSPAIVILDPQTSSCSPACGVDFANGMNLGRRTRDLFIPRVGHSWSIGDAKLRAGYLYRPGIYTEPSTGAGNAIDPDEHQFSLGYGRGFSSILAFDAPGRIDFHASYSLYPKETVTKTDGDENGNLSNVKVGSPGYETGGSEWGGGLTVQLFL